MLLKHNSGYYAKAYVHEDGKVTIWGTSSNLEVAILEGEISEWYSNLQLCLSNGWEILPPTFETLTMGDVVKDRYGTERRILSADGCGKYRLYLISHNGDTATAWTASGLKIEGSTIPTQSYQTKQTKEMTVAEVSKLVGQPVKIVE